MYFYQWNKDYYRYFYCCCCCCCEAKVFTCREVTCIIIIIIIIVIKMLACKHCLSFACKRSSKVHPASQRALVGQMRLLFSWKSIWKPCSLSAVTPNVHHACLYRVQQVLPRHVSSADSQLWWSQTKHIVTLPITRLLYCNLSHHLSSAL